MKKIIIPHLLSTYLMVNRYRLQNRLIEKIFLFVAIVAMFLSLIFGDFELFTIACAIPLLGYFIIPFIKFGASKRYYKINESYIIFEKDGISNIAGGYTLTLKKDIIDIIIITKKYLRVNVVKGQDLYILMKDQKREEIISELQNLDYRYIIK